MHILESKKERKQGKSFTLYIIEQERGLDVPRHLAHVLLKVAPLGLRTLGHVLIAAVVRRKQDAALAQVGRGLGFSGARSLALPAGLERDENVTQNSFVITLSGCSEFRKCQSRKEFGVMMPVVLA